MALMSCTAKKAELPWSSTGDSGVIVTQYLGANADAWAQESGKLLLGAVSFNVSGHCGSNVKWITVLLNGAGYGSDVECKGRAWSFAADLSSFADGDLTVSFSTFNFNKVALSTGENPLTIIKDTTVPSASSISSSSPVSPANENNPTLSGVGEPGATVGIYRDGSCSQSLGSKVIAADGIFSVSVAVSDNETVDLYTRTQDKSGNISTCASASFAYQENSLIPKIPNLTATSPVGSANMNTVRIIGTADASVTIKVFSDSTCTTLLTGGSSNVSGSFDINVTVADNSTTQFFVNAEKAGYISSCSPTSLTYIEDSLSPALPLIVGSLPASPSTNLAPAILGTTEANAMVYLYSNPTCTQQVASGKASEAGAFSVSVAVQSNTTVVIYARAEDSVGNLSGCSSTSLIYVHDSLPPVTPAITLSIPSSPANNNSPQLKGTSEAGSTVELFGNSSCQIAVATTVASELGEFSFNVVVSDNTANQYYVRATDTAGFKSACSGAAFIYEEDSVVPGTATVSAVSPLGPANNNTPTVSGTGPVSTSIVFYSDSSCSIQIGQVTSNSLGTYSGTVTVVDNLTTTVYALARDAAGNSGPCSSSFVTYTEDSLPPLAPSLVSTSPAVRGDSTMPVFLGTAEANSQIQYYSDSSCASLLGSTAADGSGNFTFQISVSADSSSFTYSKAIDAAGNISSCSSGLAYEAYLVPVGMAILRNATSTTATASATNLNQATAYSIKWPTSEFDSDYYLHQSTGANHQVQIKVAGDYLASVNLPVTGAITNGALRAQFRKNGTVLANGRCQTVYISNSSSHNESSINCSAFVSGLVANDIIDITVVQGGAAGTIAITAEAQMTLEYIGTSRAILSATATQTTNSTNLNQTTAYALRWTHGVMDSEFSHSNSTSTENVTLVNPGIYLIHLNIPVSGAIANAAVKARVQLDAVTVTGGELRQGYISNASGHTQASLHWSGFVQTTNTNQILTITTLAEAAAGTVTVAAGTVASIFVEYLSADDNLIGLTGTTLVGATTNLNVATATGLEWTSSVFKDSSIYTHSTVASPHQIVLAEGGDFTAIGSVIASGAVTRANMVCSVAVDGASVNAGQAKTHYRRNSGGHAESSSTMNFHLRKLSPGQTIQLRSQSEAAAGTVTHGGAQLLLIKRSYK